VRMKRAAGVYSLLCSGRGVWRQMGEVGSVWLVSVDSSPLKRWHHGHVTLRVDPQQRMAEGPQLLFTYEDVGAAGEAALPTQLHVRVRSM
jgi:hypothetical protein